MLQTAENQARFNQGFIKKKKTCMPSYHMNMPENITL